MAFLLSITSTRFQKITFVHHRRGVGVEWEISTTPCIGWLTGQGTKASWKWIFELWTQQRVDQKCNRILRCHL